jgi:hypothetical protein
VASGRGSNHMALLDCQSFDHIVGGDLTAVFTSLVTTDVTPTISAGNGRNGTASLRMPATANANPKGYVRSTLPVSGTSFAMGFGFNVPTAGSVRIAAIQDATVNQLCLRLNADMTMSIIRGADGDTVLGTTSASLTTSTYSYIEWKGTIHNSAGSVELRFNETVVLTVSGVDTQATGNTSWNGIGLGLNPGYAFVNGYNAVIDFDDYYINDGSGSAPWNGYYGDVRVGLLKPTAEGATINLTPSTGTDNSANVDDASPNGDTDYNSTVNIGDKDTYVMNDLPVSGVAVYGIKVSLYARKTDAGASDVAPVTRHGSTDYDGASSPLDTTYRFHQFIQMVNPGTSAQWLEADVNAAQFGAKKSA